MDVTVVAVLAGTFLFYVFMGWLFIHVYRKQWGPVRRSILVFLVLFLLDGLTGVGWFTLLIGTLAVLAQVAFCAWRALRRQGPQALAHLAAAGVYVVTVGLVAGLMAFNDRLAADRATLVIAACRAYEAKHGELPNSLDDLAPAFLPSVPRAKYTMGGAGTFFYRPTERTTQSSGAAGRLLYYYDVAFQRRVYDFEADAWELWGW